MKVLKGYVRKKAPLYILLVLFSVCIVLVNWLYEYPINASVYALFICAAIFIIYEIVSFVKYSNHMKTLTLMENKIAITLDDLPEPTDALNEEYTKLLAIVSNSKSATEHKYFARYRDLLDYYSMWAHQIKTPIQAMRLLLQTEGDDNQDLEIELLKIEQYVDMVLTYLKLDASSNDLLLKCQPIDPIIKAAVRRNAKLFIAKKITLEYEDTGIEALTDEKWLGFAIEQVLSNSLKYTNSGTVKIYKSGDYKITIEDTGIGIKKEDIPRVFERGFTGYTGREDKKATGIGLYLCHELLHKIGHKIELDSEEGVGTKVTIDLERETLDTRD